MTEKTRLQLLAWAREYHCAAFIQGDPVQFPHRYTQKQDIEVSGLLTAIMSFGNRKQILKKADGLHGLMGASPYRYVLSCRWKEDFLPTDRSSFYRMLSHADFYTYFARLHAAYTRFDSLEDALSVYPGTPMEKLCAFLEVSAKSPQKKLNMFLRWMIRCWDMGRARLPYRWYGPVPCSCMPTGRKTRFRTILPNSLSEGTWSILTRLLSKRLTAKGRCPFR